MSSVKLELFPNEILPSQYFEYKHILFEFLVQISDLVKFVMCALVSRVHIMFHKLTKGYIVPGNYSTHGRLNKIPYCNNLLISMSCK